MGADGTIRIYTDVDTNGIQAGTKQIESRIGKIGNSVRKIGGIIAAAFAATQVVQFGKECLELGSDLQEVQNVVDSVFTTMSDKVDDFAKSAATSAGLSETMAKQYVGTFGAMAKSFGFAEGEALSMSTSLTQLSGDVASFYNLTQDEAYTKLKSVFTGETESLKDLGVVMTQSALDSYAMANGFGKTTSAMTEQEKVALRYQFVMSQLSTASGDFIRTSDGWANQVKVMQLQIESLKATIGQGLINIFTPVIKVINMVLAKLATVANAFKAFTELITGNKAESSGSTGTSTEELSTGYSDAADSAADYAQATDNAADSTKNAAKAAKSYLSPLDEINKYTSSDNSSSGSGGTANTGSTGAGSVSVPTVDYGQISQGETVVDEVNDSFTKFFENLKTSITPLTAQIQRFGEIANGAFGWLLDNVLKPLANFTITEVVPRFFQTLANVLSIVNNILTALQPLWQWFWDNVLSPLLTWTGGVFLQAWDAINVALQTFSNWCAENPDAIRTITTILVSFFAAFKITELIGKIQSFITAIGGISGVMKTVGGLASKLFSNPIALAIGAVIAVGVLVWQNWDTIKTKATEIWSAISSYLSRTWNTIKTNASAIFTGIKNAVGKVWNTLSTVCSTVWSAIKMFLSNTWNSIKTTASTKWGEFKETVKGLWEGVSEKATEIFEGIQTFISGIWDGIKATATDLWEKITTAIMTPVNDIKEKVETAFGNVRKAITGAFSGIKNVIKVPVNAIIGLINGVIKAINGIVEGINNVFTFEIGFNTPDWMPGGSQYLGYKHTMNLPTINAVPYLASGAVIPPNAPFLAMLGDQKNGTNLELPESLLRKIIREELGRGGNSGGNTYKVEATCGRRTIFEIVIEEAKLQQTATGRNPFSLA